MTALWFLYFSLFLDIYNLALLPEFDGTNFPIKRKNNSEYESDILIYSSKMLGPND